MSEAHIMPEPHSSEKGTKGQAFRSQPMGLCLEGRPRHPRGVSCSNVWACHDLYGNTSAISRLTPSSRERRFILQGEYRIHELCRERGHPERFDLPGNLKSPGSRFRGNDGTRSRGPLHEVLGRYVSLVVFVAISTAFVVGSLPAQAAERVRVGLSVRNVVFLPFYYAQDRKIYQKHGLDVELIQMRSDLQTIGLVSGEIDFTPAIGPATLAIDNGMPLRAVAVIYRSPLFALVSPANITQPKQLEGRQVAVSRLGSDSHRYGVLMLEKSGVDPKKVTFLQTGSTTVSLTALQQGSVAGAVLSPPFTGAMAEKGFNVFMRSRALVEAPWLGLVTARQKVQKQPDQVRRMLRAMQEVVGSIRQDREGVTAYIERNFKVSPSVARESYEDIRDVIVEGLLMPESQIKTYLEGAHARGEINKPLTVSDIFDFSLLAK